jgi:hypothetical protein
MQMHRESGEVRSRNRAIFGAHNLGKVFLRCGCGAAERGYTSRNVTLSFEELFARRRGPAESARNFGYGCVTSLRVGKSLITICSPSGNPAPQEDLYRRLSKARKLYNVMHLA